MHQHVTGSGAEWDCMCTLGMAYTKLPIGAVAVDSPVDVVRKSIILGPLAWSWRWTFVCGARGRGNATSIGVERVSPSGIAAMKEMCGFRLRTVILTAVILKAGERVMVAYRQFRVRSRIPLALSLF